MSNTVLLEDSFEITLSYMGMGDCAFIVSFEGKEIHDPITGLTIFAVEEYCVMDTDGDCYDSYDYESVEAELTTYIKKSDKEIVEVYFQNT